MATHHLHTEIEIHAPAERVWSILANFPSYPQWNPFIRSISGVPEHGARLEVTLQPSGGKAMRFSPLVLKADAGRELRWLGRFLFSGIFDGDHRFIIEPLGNNKVRFEQSERFNGLLVGLFRSSLDRDTKRGFEEMNQALKARAEEAVESATDEQPA